MPCYNGIEIVDINFTKIYYKQFSSDTFLDLGLSEKVELVRECTEYGNVVKNVLLGLMSLK